MAKPRDPKPSPAATVMVIQMLDGSQHRVEHVTAMAWTREALIIEASQGRIYYPMSRVQCAYEPHPETPLQAVIERLG